MRKMLTPQTALDLCDHKYTDRHIRRMCQVKRIKGAELVGGTWMFTEKAFKAWLENDDFHRPGKQGR